MIKYDLTTTNFDKWLNNFRHSAIGFDRMFDRVINLVDRNTWEPVAGPAYPPYNIHKIDKYRYVIELAVAGFKKSELSCELENGNLAISGKKADVVDETEATPLHRGIANRSFTRRFTLADEVEIKGAELEDGLLKLYLEHVVPEEKKPRNIPIAAKANGKLLK